jgi:hypothetical protein
MTSNNEINDNKPNNMFLRIRTIMDDTVSIEKFYIINVYLLFIYYFLTLLFSILLISSPLSYLPFNKKIVIIALFLLYPIIIFYIERFFIFYGRYLYLYFSNKPIDNSITVY